MFCFNWNHQLKIETLKAQLTLAEDKLHDANETLAELKRDGVGNVTVNLTIAVPKGTDPNLVAKAVKKAVAKKTTTRR